MRENIDIAKKLSEIRLKTGKSQADFAGEVGIPQTTWSGYERGQTTPKMGVLWALAAKGYVIEGLTSNFIDDMPVEARKEIEEKTQIIRAAFPEDMLLESIRQYVEYVSKFDFFKFSDNKPLAIPSNEDDYHAMVLLPLYSQKASAGPGQELTQLEESKYMPVLLRLLRGAQPKDCGLITVRGDSMTDIGLFDDDIAIFDKSRIEGDGIYVISVASEVRIKRLEYKIFDKKIIIKSENAKRYPDPEIISYEQAEEMLQIHGKVLGWIHGHPY